MMTSFRRSKQDFRLCFTLLSYRRRITMLRDYTILYTNLSSPDYGTSQDCIEEIGEHFCKVPMEN